MAPFEALEAFCGRLFDFLYDLEGAGLARVPTGGWNKLIRTVRAEHAEALEGFVRTSHGLELAGETFAAAIAAAWVRRPGPNRSGAECRESAGPVPPRRRPR